jgi:hypothetical protein
MKRFVLPSGVELAILATSAVLCAAILAGMPGYDFALVVLAFALGLGAMLMGARRTGQLASSPARVGDDRVQSQV